MILYVYFSMLDILLFLVIEYHGPWNECTINQVLKKTLSTNLAVYFLETFPIHKKNDRHRIFFNTTVNVAKDNFMTSKLNPSILNNKQCKLAHAQILNDNRGAFCGSLNGGQFQRPLSLDRRTNKP